MTPQEILDTSYVGLMKQGDKSTDRLGSCRYRGNKGMKCGVGFLLSDKAGKAFDKRYLSSAIHGVVDSKSKYVEEWMRNNISLLCEIQAAHDTAQSYGFRDYITRQYHEIATRHNLTLPNVDVTTGELIND